MVGPVGVGDAAQAMQMKPQHITMSPVVVGADAPMPNESGGLVAMCTSLFASLPMPSAPRSSADGAQPLLQV